jgi:hypothetical protein
MLLLSGIAATDQQLLTAFAGIPPDFGVDPRRVILVTVILITGFDRPLGELA